MSASTAKSFGFGFLNRKIKNKQKDSANRINGNKSSLLFPY